MKAEAETQQRFEQEEQAYWRQRDDWRKTGSGLMYVNLVGGEDLTLRVRPL
jgi:hypothetical protein